MTAIKTFPKGGVHPEENKLSSQAGIQVLPVPEVVHIPVTQHLGAPSRVLVKKGDKVNVGQLIAESDGFVSSRVHSSVSGTVSKVEPATDASGYKKLTVTITVEGDEWENSIDRSESLNTSITLSPDEIIKKVQEAGVVGLGGATFPSHVKMTIPKGKRAQVVIINGVECEPFLTSDHALMLSKPAEIIMGVKIMMRALEVEKAIIGIEKNKPDAIERLSVLAASEEGITVQPLKVKYPQGGEKQLIKALTGREVPSGGLPIDVGAVVFNVASTYAIYEAIQKNKPLIDRVITITGQEVKMPGNFLARIGTPIGKLVDAAGGFPENTGRVISGGPMMGKAITGIDVPVTKGCSGILLIPEEAAHRKAVLNCIRCGKCVSVCPMGLEPYLLMALSERTLYDRLEMEHVLDCIECGSCSFICPSNRPLLDHIRLSKSTVNKIIRSRKN